MQSSKSRFPYDMESDASQLSRAADPTFSGVLSTTCLWFGASLHIQSRTVADHDQAL
jgi:hypothetical protein